VYKELQVVTLMCCVEAMGFAESRLVCRLVFTTDGAGVDAFQIITNSYALDGGKLIGGFFSRVSPA